VVEVKSTACGACGALLLGDGPQPQHQQVTKLPRVQPEVTEYRRHTLTCLACGVANTPGWPDDMPMAVSGHGSKPRRAISVSAWGRISVISPKPARRSSTPR